MKIRNCNEWLIGDPHLGRNFDTGMPLHRRGHRAAMQREQFQAELATPDMDTITMIGDLFDKPVVPLPVLSAAIQDVIQAAQDRPSVQFIMMAGNHDISRQLGQQGAWEIFSLAVGWLPNVHVLTEPALIGGSAYFPWQWEVTAADQVQALIDSGLGEHVGKIENAIGHWDLVDFGGDTSHIAPIPELMALNGNMDFYSGHYHLEGEFLVNQVNVFCTGSMQPYAHGEGDMYVTLTVEEALARDDLYDKCVRILLGPDEVMPDIDCFQLTRKRADTVGEEVELRAVGAQSFNLANTLASSFEQQEVPEPVQIFIKEKLSVSD